MPVVRLLVLGIIRSQGSAHGYIVQQVLENWQIETWTKVRIGSIYHALKQLHKEKKLAVVREETGEGPSRVVYALTPDGEAEFSLLVRKSLGSFDLETLGAGIAFIHTVPRKEALQLLDALRASAEENVDRLNSLTPKFPNLADPPHTADLLALWSGSLATIARFADRIIQQLEADRY